MKGLTARGMPQLRKELLFSHSQDSVTGRMMHHLLPDGGSLLDDGSAFIMADQYQKELLPSAYLWWVSRDSGDLIAQASASITDDLKLSDIGEAALKQMNGPIIVGFEEGFRVEHEYLDSEKYTYLEELLTVAPGTHEGELVLAASWYGRTLQWMQENSNDETIRRAVAAGIGNEWVSHTSTVWRETDTVSDGEDYETDIRRFLASMLALVNEPHVITAQDQLDRATRRRAAREGRDSQLDAVRVHSLRGSASENRRAAEDSEVGYWKHRWVVDGHWRSQPCGPGRKNRRLTWIAPYLKGPDGAPLLTGEKVKKL